MGDFGEALRYLCVVKRDDIYSDGILSLSVNDGSKIVFHSIFSYKYINYFHEVMPTG